MPFGRDSEGGKVVVRCCCYDAGRRPARTAEIVWSARMEVSAELGGRHGWTPSERAHTIAARGASAPAPTASAAPVVGVGGGSRVAAAVRRHDGRRPGAR